MLDTLAIFLFLVITTATVLWVMKEIIERDKSYVREQAEEREKKLLSK